MSYFNIQIGMFMVKTLALQENSIIEHAFIFVHGHLLTGGYYVYLNYQNNIKNPQIIGYSPLMLFWTKNRIKTSWAYWVVKKISENYEWVPLLTLN